MPLRDISHEDHRGQEYRIGRNPEGRTIPLVNEASPNGNNRRTPHLDGKQYGGCLQRDPGRINPQGGWSRTYMRIVPPRRPHRSFRINTEKACWYCDPCGKGGDAFDLARLVWAVDFTGACKRLAEIAGINGHTAPLSLAERAKTPRKEVRRLRYEIRDLRGELKATHHRIEYDDATKSMPWDPKGIKPAELPL